MKIRFFSFVLFLSFSVFMSAQDSDEAATAASVYNDGVAALKTKDYETALNNFLQAIELADPEKDAKVVGLAKRNGASAAYALGNTAMKAKEYDAAMSKYEKGFELNPDSYTCAYGKAKVLAAKGDDGAMDAYFTAAELAKAADKADRAESYIKSASKIISKAYFAKEYDKTVASAEKYLTVGESVDVRYYIAKALIKQKNGSAAVEHAMKAKELGGVEKEGKFMMVYAEALEASGDKTGAAKAYAEVPQGKYFESAQYKAKNMR